jgi:hypothetical protein
VRWPPGDWFRHLGPQRGRGDPKDDVTEVAQRVRDRALRWPRRRGHLDERAAYELSNEVAEPSAIDGCTQLARLGGAFLATSLLAER